MVKNNTKLREGLQSLFKERGETLQSKEFKTEKNNSAQNVLKTTRNKQKEIRTEGMPCGVKKNNKNFNNKNQNVKNQKKSVQQKPKTKTKAKIKENGTEMRSNGFYVLNHKNQEEQKGKLKSKQLNGKNKKTDNDSKAKNKQPKKIQQENNLEKKQSKKRTAVALNGPKSKKPKLPTELVEYEEEPFDEIAEYSDTDASDIDYDSELEETECEEEFSDEYSFESEDYGDSDDMDDTYTSEDDDDDDDDDDGSSYEYADEFDHDFHNTSDPDYRLPKDQLEDLIVHKGLAVTYKLTEHHGVDFDEETEETQIIELPTQTPVKSVSQLEEYSIDHLRSLELKFHEKIGKKAANNDNDVCPKLVPIDDVNFQLWTSGVNMDDQMFSSEEDDFESDESVTIAEGNVNDKYLKPNEHLTSSDDSEYDEDGEVSDDDSDDEDFGTKLKPLKNVDIIAADSLKCQEHKFHIPVSVSKTEPSLAEIIAKKCSNSNVAIKTIPLFNFETRKESEENCVEYQETGSPKNYDTTTGMISPPNVTASPEMNDEDIFDKFSTEDSTNADAFNEYLETAQPTQTFETKFFNSNDANQVLVHVKTTFYIYGTVKATLVAGAAEIYGYKLKILETQQLFSPRGCSAIEIKAIPSSTASSKSNKTSARNVHQNILATLATLSDNGEFYQNDIEKILKDFEPSTDALLLMARNDDAKKIKLMLQQHISENIFPAQIPLSRTHYATEYLLDCMINVNTEYPLIIPEQWLRLYLRQSSKFLVIGGKSVGKSTLVRYLVNNNLHEFPQILLIDLDIGQPEIFSSQTVSCALLTQPLLGPGFFYQMQPDKAYAIGHSNVVLCAHAYMRAVLKLLKYCSEEPRYHGVPWIVNTMGYNKGFSAELISVICEHLRPTDILQLQSNIAINNFDLHFQPNVMTMIQRRIYDAPEYGTQDKLTFSHRLHILPSAVLQQSRFQREWQMSAKDMRYIMLLVRLSRVLPDEGEYLNLSQTFGCSLDKLKLVNFVSKNAADTLESLNSNLVYFCCNPCYTSNSTEENVELDTVECLGIGIVRAIDFYGKMIYVLPALPTSELLSQVNCLALGDMALPATILTQQSPEAEHGVPFVQDVSDEATSRAVKQFFYRT